MAQPACQRSFLVKGLVESNWRDGAKKDPNFAASETPCFVGRALVALAADPDIAQKAGGLYSSSGLAEEYGFTDLDGERPNLGKHFAATLGEFPFGRPHTSVRWQLGSVPGQTQRTRVSA